MDDVNALASRLIGQPRDAALSSSFVEALGRQLDVESLRSLAEMFTPHTDISIPTYQRILEIVPKDVGALTALGFCLWLDGEDDEAAKRLLEAKRVDAGDVRVLTFEAALTNDRTKKVSLYKLILEKDPENVVAKENLRELGSR